MDFEKDFYYLIHLPKNCQSVLLHETLWRLEIESFEAIALAVDVPGIVYQIQNIQFCLVHPEIM